MISNLSTDSNGKSKTPLAYMGDAPEFDTPTVKICMCCPDKTEAEALAQKQGKTATHGLCAECFKREMDKIALYLKEKA